MSKNYRWCTDRLVTVAACILAAGSSFLAPMVAASPVPLQNATATFSQTYSGSFMVSQSIDGIVSGQNGWAIHPEEGQNQTAVFETVSDVGKAGGTRFTFVLSQLLGSYHTIGHFSLAVTTDDRSAFADGLQKDGDVTANWTMLIPLTVVSEAGATMTKLGDNSILVSGVNPQTDIYTVTANTYITRITGIRLEALTDPSFTNNGPGRQPTNGNFVLTEFQVSAVPIPEPGIYALMAAGLGLLPLVPKYRRS